MAENTPANSRKRTRRTASSSNVDKYLSFAFGVIFVSVLLWLVFRNQDPLTSGQAHMVHLVSALAAAGVGAALPGVIALRHRNIIRAGGAIALFVVVYLFKPAQAVAPPGTWPSSDPSEAVARHLTLIDSENYRVAYDELSPESRKRLTLNEFLAAFEAGRKPFGAVTQRTLLGISPVEGQPGLPPVPSKLYAYRTVFSTGTNAVENVLAISGGKQDWQVMFHTVNPCPNNQCPGSVLAPAATAPGAPAKG